jgi:CubicO group peptidase (beta-lactamase class C family)
MKSLLTLLFVVAAAVSKMVWSGNDVNWTLNKQQFHKEVSELKSHLNIPGLAYVVIKDDEVIAKSAFGWLQHNKDKPFLSSTPLRIASVTKSLTTVVIMQLVEEGKVELDTPVKDIIPKLNMSSQVNLRHLLTHTSEGNVGESYVYGTNRYAILGQVIETITKQSLKTVFEKRIQLPSGMKVYDSPHLGAHAGLVSSVDEMMKYFMALAQGKLLTVAYQESLYKPSVSTSGQELPVSLGWFAQRIYGEDVVWSFGQDDPEHSGALWLYVPSKKLTLFILANANTLSDPFRLLMGDVTKSPFAMSFLRTFLFSKPNAPIALSFPVDGTNSVNKMDYNFELEWVGHALIDLWNKKPKEALIKLKAANAYADGDHDPVTHFAALRLPDDFVKDSALSMGKELLSANPKNRWILLAQGYLLQQRSRIPEAVNCFQRILDLPNQQQDFINRLFLVWSWTALAEMSMNDAPQKAKQYLTHIVESGIKGPSLENAKKLLNRIDSKGG